MDLVDVLAEQATAQAEGWLRTGTVTGVGQLPQVNVTLDGGDLLLPKLGGYYAPVVGDVVSVLCAPGRKLVLGRIGDGAPPGPQGLVARTQRSTAAATTSGTAVGVTRLSAALTSGRSYRVEATGISMHSGSAGLMSAWLAYTTNGADPGTGDTKLIEGFITTPASGSPATLSLSTIYNPGSNLTLKILLAYNVIQGGTGGMICLAGRTMELLVTDSGPALAAGGTQL